MSQVRESAPPRAALTGFFILSVLTLLLLPAVPGFAAEEPPPALGVTLEAQAGAELVTAVFPGPILSAVVPGGGSLIVLVGGEKPDAPTSLYRLRLPSAGGQPELTVLASGLQGGAAGLEVVDLDGDGTREVLYGVPGNLYSLGHPQLGTAEAAKAAVAGKRHLLADPRFDPRARPGDRLRGDALGGPWLASPEVGKLELYRIGATLGQASSYRLPVRVRRTEAGLHLTTEPVSVVERPGGSPLFVSGPDAQGRQRLRTVLVDPDLPPGDEAAVADAWSLLPGPERIEQSWYAWMGKRPVLIVAAQSADKIGIFEKKRLRVFPLRPDRTRSGSRTVLDVVTENLRWYPMRIEVMDVDADGLDDLVTLQSKGLGAGKLHLEAFLSTPAGRFSPTTKSSTLEIDFTGADYGRDLTGDGLADLVLASESEIQVYPGEQAKRRLVAKKPLWRVPLGLLEADRQVTVSIGTGGGSVKQQTVRYDQLTTLDVDGDGRAEAILMEAALRGRGVIKVVRFGR